MKAPWANGGQVFLRKPDAANPHVRFDERGCGNGTVSVTAPPLDSTPLYSLPVVFPVVKRLEPPVYGVAVVLRHGVALVELLCNTSIA